MCKHTFFLAAFFLIYFSLALSNRLLDHLDFLLEIGWSLPLLLHKIHGLALLRDILVDAQ